MNTAIDGHPCIAREVQVHPDDQDLQQSHFRVLAVSILPLLRYSLPATMTLRPLPKRLLGPDCRPRSHGLVQRNPFEAAGISDTMTALIHLDLTLDGATNKYGHPYEMDHRTYFISGRCLLLVWIPSHF